MRLRVFLPSEVLVDTEVVKIGIETPDGARILLPRHVDFVTLLVPGVMTFVRPDGDEDLVALNEGVLVKIGPDVRVATRNAVFGESLSVLREVVEREFKHLDEQERRARAALHGLEMEIVRRFITLGE
ncbi:MAG: F0F1 ATP synthase subunit epsilon [Chloroflexota bacterium]